MICILATNYEESEEDRTDTSFTSVSSGDQSFSSSFSSSYEESG